MILTKTVYSQYITNEKGKVNWWSTWNSIKPSYTAWCRWHACLSWKDLLSSFLVLNKGFELNLNHKQQTLYHHHTLAGMLMTSRCHMTRMPTMWLAEDMVDKRIKCLLQNMTDSPTPMNIMQGKVYKYLLGMMMIDYSTPPGGWHCEEEWTNTLKSFWLRYIRVCQNLLGT